MHKSAGNGSICQNKSKYSTFAVIGLVPAGGSGTRLYPMEIPKETDPPCGDDPHLPDLERDLRGLSGIPRRGLPGRARCFGAACPRRYPLPRIYRSLSQLPPLPMVLALPPLAPRRLEAKTRLSRIHVPHLLCAAQEPPHEAGRVGEDVGWADGSGLNVPPASVNPCQLREGRNGNSSIY